MKRKEAYYIKKSSKGLKALEEGLMFYPQNISLNRQMAEFYTEKKIWDKSVQFWEEVIKNQGNHPNTSDSINLAMALNKVDNYNKSIKILSEIIKSDPKNQEARYVLVKTYGLNKDHLKAISLWEMLLKEKQFKATEEDYLELADNYSKVQNYNESMNTLLTGLKKYKKSLYLISMLVEVTLLMQNWENALTYLMQYKKLNKDENKALDIDVQISMIQQLLGNRNDADITLQKALNEGMIREEGYKKLNIFDNGDTRIEFYKKLEKTNRVIIVFDSINITWDRKPFAFNLLLRQDLDIIAVRKRKKSYLQDFSLEDFNNAVHKLVGSYSEKYAYGFSLGAYATLYYTSKLNCKILALSPRLSIHPEFGKEKQRGAGFLHESSFEENDGIEPIIAFDPKNKLDKKYINEGIKPYFPNAHFIELPYGGHGIAPHLLKMGLLKEFVLKFLQNEVPAYDKKLRKQSSSYYRVLGDACFKRNKPRWALNLVEHATYLDPEDGFNMRLKIHVLNGLGKHKEAVNFAKYCKLIKRNDRVIRSLLIDSLVYMNNMEDAQQEVNEYIQKFGKTPAILKKEEQLKERIELLQSTK